jgi:tetratricopeptide (TPR) repeat protein
MQLILWLALVLAGGSLRTQAPGGLPLLHLADSAQALPADWSEQFELTADVDGTLVAWAGGHGVRLTLSLFSEDATELAVDTSASQQRAARVEWQVERGQRFVLQVAGQDQHAWAFARASAAVSAQSAATRTAGEFARAALLQASQLERASDHEAQREVIAGAISALALIPDADRSLPVADALWTLVFPAFSCGALDAAGCAANQCLRVREQFEPAESRLVQSTRIGVANVLQEMMRFEPAAEWTAQAVMIYERTRSADDLELAKFRLNLANLLRRLGEFERPAAMIAEALAVYECQLDWDQPERQRAESIAAELDEAMGRYEAAAARFREIYRLALQTGDDDVIFGAAGNYAVSLSNSGEFERSRQIEEDNLRRAEQRWPSEHPSLILMRGNLAVSLMALGDLPRARALLELALAAHESDPELSPLSAMRVYCNLAELERRSGDDARAKELFERALEISTRFEDPSESVMPLNGLARTLLAEGEWERAHAMLERLVNVRLATSGPAGLLTQTARLALASCLMERGQMAQAAELVRSALDALSAALPSDDQRIFDARLLLMCARFDSVPAAESAQALADWQRDAAALLARDSLSASPRSSGPIRWPTCSR